MPYSKNMKKKIWNKTSLGALFMLFGTALTACSNSGFEANLTSLNQLRTSASKNTNLTQNKADLVTALKSAFENNPEGTTRVLLDAWKFTLLDAQILEKQDFSKFSKSFGSGRSIEDVEPSAGVRGLRLVERYTQDTANIINNVIKLDKQKVEAFSIQYKDPKNFRVQVKINAKGNYKKDTVKTYLSQVGLSDGDLNDTGTLEAEIIYTYMPPAASFFSASKFDKLTRAINFNTNLRIQIIGKDSVMTKLLQQSSFVKQLADQKFQDQLINLLPYVLYSIL
ncbi:putative lipoprotein MG440 homolog [Mycoplasmoides pneumoniae]|nr:putative lipoprotein MG440 homolog [Mycoplasmoides pneumoniae]